MSLHQVQNTVIGTSLTTSGAVNTLTAGGIGFLNDAQAYISALTAGGLSQDFLTGYQSNTDGSYKKTMRIPVARINKVTATAYKPATRNVTTIGYKRASIGNDNSTVTAASGSIVVTPSEYYNFNLLFKDNKNLYSERPYRRSYSIISSAVATQLTIATQIASAINTDGANDCTAIVVGDGTGVYGVTGATNYGVEITGKVLTQFSNSYNEDRVYYEVTLDDASGFGTTPTAVTLNVSYGEGTYLNVYNKENFDWGYEGVTNRRIFPIPVLAFNSSSAGIASGTLAAFTVTGTAGEDQLTFSAAGNTQLPAGSFITVSGNNYEIKYWVSTTVAVLNTVLLTSPSTTAVSAKAWYDVFNIQFSDPIISDGANTTTNSMRNVYIAVPAINTGATAMTTASTVSTAVVTLLTSISVVNPAVAAVAAV